MATVRCVVTFDIPDGPIGPYDADDGLGQLRRLPGVQQAVLYESREGKPDYLLDVQADDASYDGVQKALDRLVGEYSSYLTNVTRRRYRVLA